MQVYSDSVKVHLVADNETHSEGEVFVTFALNFLGLYFGVLDVYIILI